MNQKLVFNVLPNRVNVLFKDQTHEKIAVMDHQATSLACQIPSIAHQYIASVPTHCAPRMPSQISAKSQERRHGNSLV